MAWSGEHRAFVIETYFKNGDSVICTQRLFRTHFGISRHGAIPDRKTILTRVRNFRVTSSAMKKPPPGRPRSVRTPQNVQLLQQAVTRSPRRPARRHAASLGISDRTVRRILHQDLHFHPYKIMVVQELSERDRASRIASCHAILENVPNNAVVLSSDEAHFHLSGYVNKQNFRYRAENNPRQLHERPLHSQHVTVWCAVADFGIIGPYFFEEEGRTVTVTSQRYVHMLNNFLKPKPNEIGNRVVWYQQDGATAHTARQSMEVLRQMFPGRLISLRGNMPWPARSPDLAACDFFLWGYLKSKVYKNKPRTTDELKAAIRHEIAEIPQEMTTRVMHNFRVRLQSCIDNDGRHLNDIIFK